MVMQCLHLNHVTVTFLEVLQRNGYDFNRCINESRIVNFSIVTKSSDVSLQMYASPQCLTAGALIQMYFSVV